MKLLKGVVTGVSFAVLTLGVAQAQDKPASKIDPATQTGAAPAAKDPQKKQLNPWIDCGIGAMIFDETGWAAVTSNIVWDYGLTATTSNVSSDHLCNSKRAKTALFIGTVYANLAEEMAKGEGSHLRALLDLRGCDAAAHSAILASLRPQFARSLSDPAYALRKPIANAERFFDTLETTISSAHEAQCRA